MFDYPLRWVAYDLGTYLTLAHEDLSGGAHESYDYPIPSGETAESVAGSLGYLATYGWETVHSAWGDYRQAVVDRVSG